MRSKKKVFLSPFTICHLPSAILHVSSILTPDLKQSRSNLSERTILRCFHQSFKNIFVLHGSKLEVAQEFVRSVCIASVELFQHFYLVFLFFFCCADDFFRQDRRRTFGREVGIYPDNRELACVLEGFVIQTFFLNFSALVHNFHSAKNSTAFGDLDRKSTRL